MRVSIRAGKSVVGDAKGDVCLSLGFSAHTSNNANFSNIISERDVPVMAPANSRSLCTLISSWRTFSVIHSVSSSEVSSPR